MNPETRKIIYTTAAGIIPILISLGYITGPEGKNITDALAALIALATSVLARVNVK